MYYHVRITQKSNRLLDELKLDLSEEELRNQFVTPYENNENIVVNGKTISPDDIERIKINKTKDHSSKIIPVIRATRPRSAGLPILDEWYVTKEGEDVTDYFIQGAPGYKKRKLGKKIENIKPKSNQIFVVHGYDEYMKEAVAQTLEKMDLEPIILHEQENIGKTIIERFESCSENVSFAIVLLSPDDLGYKKDQSPKSAMFRARQNVILELGYFIGKLGKNNVVVLHKNEKKIEFPSDILGILYIPFDQHKGWKRTLAKEIKAAGYDIDLEQIIT